MLAERLKGCITLGRLAPILLGAVVLSAGSPFMHTPGIHADSLSASLPDSSSAPRPKSLLYRESHALVIGIGKYDNGWPSLPGVQQDIEETRRALVRSGFEVDIIENASRDVLDSIIRKFIDMKCLQPDNRIVIYFAGHGYTLRQSFGGEMGYIVPADAPLPSVDEPGFRSRAIDMQQFEVYARRIQAKHALFVFDSCFSGSIFSQLRGHTDFIIDKAAQPVRQFITSGSAYESVPDESAFCRQFIMAIGGAGDLNADGYVSGTELGEFLKEQVINYSGGGQHPQYGKLRDFNLDKGDILFEVSPRMDGSLVMPDPAVVPRRTQPAQDFVIAVAPFWGPTPEALQEGALMKALVERNIYDLMEGENGVHLIHEQLDIPLRNHEQAREIGKALGASIVIWGDVLRLLGEIEIQPYITRMETFDRLRQGEPRPLRTSVLYPDQLQLRRVKASEIVSLSLLMAGTYYQYKDSQRALDLLNQIAPPMAEALRFMAMIHYEANHADEAVAILQRAIELSPDDVQLRVFLARVYSHLGNYQLAIETSETALSVAPDSPWPHIWLGSFYYDLGRYDDAMRSLSLAERATKDAGYLAQMNLGHALNKLGRCEEAMCCYRRAIDLDPGAAEPQYRMGTVLVALGDYHGALDSLRKAATLAPRWVWIQNQIGGVYTCLEDYPNALAALEQALQMDPNYVWTYQNLGALLLLLDRPDEALVQLRKAMALSPELLQIRLFLHLAMYKSGQSAMADRLIREFTIAPDDSSTSAAIARLLAGYASEAELLEQTASPSAYVQRLNECEAHYFLGMSYLLGAAPRLSASAPDTDAAVAHLQKCLATKIYRFVEYDYAKAELKKINGSR